MLAKIGAGSISVIVPGSGGVTVPGAQRNCTLKIPPTRALINSVLLPAVGGAVGIDCCRKSISPVGGLLTLVGIRGLDHRADVDGDVVHSRI